jgi:hypothetical protein
MNGLIPDTFTITIDPTSILYLLGAVIIAIIVYFIGVIASKTV